ncbi:MAG: prenyltransferase [Actinomycetota bacterium]
MANERGLPLLARATRAKVLPVMLAPVAVGATLGWERSGFFSWGWFLVTLAGAAAMHLAANVVNDVYDEDSGAEPLARRDSASHATGSGVLGAQLMSRRALLGLAAALFGVALACAIALAFAGRPAVLWLGAIGFVLAVAYVAPPIRYGYVGRGLGEAGIFAAFGILPVVGSYYVQTLVIDSAALWASVVPGLLTTLVLYHHHFLRWRSDREARKMTPVAWLGPERALAISAVAVGIVVVTLAVQSLVLLLWPPGAFAASATAAPIIVTQRAAAEEPGMNAYARLLGASLGASVLAAAWLVGAEVVRVALR